MRTDAQWRAAAEDRRPLAESTDPDPAATGAQRPGRALRPGQQAAARGVPADRGRAQPGRYAGCAGPLGRAQLPRTGCGPRSLRRALATPARAGAYTIAPAAILAQQRRENRHDRHPGCTGARRR
ncbi:hypothetical protein G6F35_017101 [Rhizopus arrhizus]|nr:hypothetical protein G6F35_017101 [Rhizopus arrhizus]